MPYDPTKPNSGFTPDEIAAARARGEREKAAYARIHQAASPAPATKQAPAVYASSMTPPASVRPASYSGAGRTVSAAYAPPTAVQGTGVTGSVLPAAPAPAPAPVPQRQTLSRSPYYQKPDKASYMYRGVDFGGNEAAYQNALSTSNPNIAPSVQEQTDEWLGEQQRRLEELPEWKRSLVAQGVISLG